MRFPQEIVVQRFLPTYRALLARALSERGLPQKTIAGRIGVTQAQVSKYLSGKLTPEPALADDPRVAATVEAVADSLASGRLDTVGALSESLELIGRLQNQGPLARMHEEAMPALRGTGFDARLAPASLAMQEHQVLTELRLALRRLVGVPGFGAWVPHVGSNLAQARPGAETIWDVAALPGRIDAVAGAARVTTEPSFGASEHVATVVLAVMDVAPEVRAALNIAYRPELEALAAEAGLEARAFDASYEARRAQVAEQVAAHQEATGQVPHLIYHTGAFGIEPVAYLVDADALQLVERLERLLAAP